MRTYTPDLEEFGPIGFEIQLANTPQGGGRPTEFALLNEQQATMPCREFFDTPKLANQPSKTLLRYFERKSGNFEVPRIGEHGNFKVSTNSGRNPQATRLHENGGNAKLTLLGELFLKNFEEMGTAPAAQLKEAVAVAGKGAPGAWTDPRWGKLPPELRDDPEAQAAWADWIPPSGFRIRGGGGKASTATLAIAQVRIRKGGV